MTHQFSVTVTAGTLGELIANIQTTLSTLDTLEPKAVTTKKAATTKKTAAPQALEEDMLGDDAGEATEETEELGFDSEEEKPAKKAASKAKKITDKEINAAAVAHAKENGRPATLAILQKKFKVKSILELKPEQYPAVLAALEV